MFAMFTVPTEVGSSTMTPATLAPKQLDALNCPAPYSVRAHFLGEAMVKCLHKAEFTANTVGRTEKLNKSISVLLSIKKSAI
jgi:hypothetical protein